MRPDEISDIVSQDRERTADLSKKINDLFLGLPLGTICMAVALTRENLKRSYPVLMLTADNIAATVPKTEEVENG